VAGRVAAGCTSSGNAGRDGGADFASSPDDLAAASDFAGPPADLSSVNDASPCDPSGGCASGPSCGGACCGAGQYCDPRANACSCGGGAACPAGSACVSNVPVACGFVCCPPTCPP
jgi:hypothetical protein